MRSQRSSGHHAYSSALPVGRCRRRSLVGAETSRQDRVDVLGRRAVDRAVGDHADESRRPRSPPTGFRQATGVSQQDFHLVIGQIVDEVDQFVAVCCHEPSVAESGVGGRRARATGCVDCARWQAWRNTCSVATSPGRFRRLSVEDVAYCLRRGSPANHVSSCWTSRRRHRPVAIWVLIRGSLH